jgi:hypothetical protein
VVAEHLFIGGPADGKRIELPHPPPLTVVVPVYAGALGGSDRLEYTRETLRDGVEEFTVYSAGFNRINSSGVIRELISGYRRFST